ncbi:restriction endonuclease subunit S [Elizabethkingia anophelis]|nr:restriction endonuclease subunit S [Elizabethkingia anophelis]
MAKIKDLFNLQKGTLQSSKCISGEFDFITASKNWKTHNTYSHECEALIFAAAASGSLGRTHYVNGKFITSDLCFIITPKNEKTYPIDLKFYHIIFNALKDDIVKNTKAGTSKEAIGLKSLGDYDLPYVDIQKQVKISRKFNEITKISDNCDSVFIQQLDLIKDLRQAFLREAMQGLLVSNETSDGKTGADLLAEIQAEKAQLIKEKKIKKPKPLAPITQEEIPFEIPENWTWCRLGDILKDFLSGNAFKSQLYSKTETNNYIIRLGNVKNNNIDEKLKAAYIDDRYAEQSKKYLLDSTDILITMTGTRGKKDYLYTGIVGLKGSNKLYLNQRVGCLRFIHSNIFYINYLLKLDYILDSIFDSSTGAANQANIGVDAITNTIIPLPSLTIQEHIVAKLDGLMAFCDQLEEQIKQSQRTNDLLLQQVLREALGEKKEEKGELTELQLVAEPIEQYIAKPFTTKTCDKNDMAVLTGYIIQELNTKDFGRVKLQKMLHLVEFHCQLETNFNYYKKVAGPHAEELKESIEPILQRNRFFDIKKEKLGNKEKVNYTALAGASQINKFFNSDFKEQKENIDFLLHKFRNKTWEFCEMISTMYAVWNNRLIKQQSITNDDLKKDFLEWDKEKIKFVDQLDYAIEWIKKENMEPKGLGKYIDKPQTK